MAYIIMDVSNMEKTKDQNYIDSQKNDVYVAIQRAMHAIPSGNLHNLTFSYLLERKEHHIKRIYADAYLSLFIYKVQAM